MMITKEYLQNHLALLKIQRDAAHKQMVMDELALTESTKNFHKFEGGMSAVRNLISVAVNLTEPKQKTVKRIPINRMTNGTKHS